jgi:spore maturation protein CgeB
LPRLIRPAGFLDSNHAPQREANLLALPLYCSFDPEHYRFCPLPRFRCDLSYMGTYARDRQPKIEEFLCKPAGALSQKRFLVAGPQYPNNVVWPGNVKRIVHLEPKFHAAFYSSSRLTLNVTRREMVEAGYSPSVRLFEAAACGATIISDRWDGLDTFFVSGQQILLPESSSEVVDYLTEMDEAEMERIGDNAQARVLAEHSAEQRALEFEDYVSGVGSEPKQLATVTTVTPAPG